MTSVAAGRASTGIPDCPVCMARETGRFATIDGRRYFRCAICEATFLEPAQRPSPAEELAHYRHHENDPADPAYRAFLSKFATPLVARLPPGAAGLDYGCGPGPALAAMLRETGHAIALYDPFFQADEAALSATYDFITCTEAAEHFHDPSAEFDCLDGLLRPGGLLGVMTCFQDDDTKFERWHYRMDPTHVVFYRAATFMVIAQQRGWACEIPVKDVAIMRKPGRA